jgi:hypothetical protein
MDETTILIGDSYQGSAVSAGAIVPGGVTSIPLRAYVAEQDRTSGKTVRIYGEKSLDGGFSWQPAGVMASGQCEFTEGIDPWFMIVVDTANLGGKMVRARLDLPEQVVLDRVTAGGEF